MKALVSVIIPFKNRVDFISEAIESVVNQSHPQIELLLINDNSTEGSLTRIYKLIKKYAKSNCNIELYNSHGNGAPFARNLGIEKSKGDFIQFLDSDDILLPKKIENQLIAFSKHPSIELVYSKAQFIDEKKNKLDDFWGRPLDKSYLDYFLFSYQTMCPLYKRGTIRKYGNWDESLSINQDWEFSLRYIIKGAKCYYLDEVNSLFRVHSLNSVGKEFNISKIRGKWNSTLKIFNLLKAEQKLSKNLKQRFVKRFLYAFCLSSSNGYTELKNNQLKSIRNELDLKSRILFAICSNKFFAHSLLKIYN